MTRRAIVRTTAAIGLLLAAALPASADPPMVIDPASAASQIEITYATLVVVGPVPSECVSFVNHSTHIAKRVRFLFTKLDDNGTDIGTDTLDRYGNFAPNVGVEGMHSSRDVFSRSRVANCKDTSFSRRTPASIRAAVNLVEWDDGTSWQAPPSTPAPIRPATPAPTSTPEPEPSPSPSPAPTYSP